MTKRQRHRLINHQRRRRNLADMKDKKELSDEKTHQPKTALTYVVEEVL